jgi:hypothetical protein
MYLTCLIDLWARGLSTPYLRTNVDKNMKKLSQQWNLNLALMVRKWGESPQIVERKRYVQEDVCWLLKEWYVRNVHNIHSMENTQQNLKMNTDINQHVISGEGYITKCLYPWDPCMFIMCISTKWTWMRHLHSTSLFKGSFTVDS